MKKTLLTKTLLLLFALIAGSSSSWAATSTLTPTSEKIAPSDDHFTVTYGGSGSDTKWNSTCLRLYAKNTITFASKNAEKITQITFTGTVNANSKGKYPDTMTASVGTITPSTISATGETDFSWTYATGATEVTLTVGGTAGNIDLTGGSFVVTYTAGAAVNVTGVTVDPTEWEMEVGETKELTATVAPAEATNKAITWSSDKESVATVDEDGVVTAVAAGTANITVTTTDGSKTATCAITVNPAPAVALTLDFSTNILGLGVGSSNKATASAGFTYGGYTYTLAAADGYYYNTGGGGYVMIGKSGSTFTFPAFPFNVSKIIVYGTSGASESVKQNIYVGETAVSTETTGAKNVTNEYEIEEAYQAAGNVYVLKVTSNANTQISKIEIFGYVTTPAVTAAGWASYVTPKAVRFAEGEAFAVTAAGSGVVTLAEVTDVPNNFPVLLKGEGAKTALVLETSPAAPTNKLSISNGGSVEGYVLAEPAGNPVGFYKWAGGSLTSGKVYLPASAVAGAPDFLGFGGDATGIDEVRGKTEEVRGEFYNLAGQRVAQPTKGLYIVNGKKVVMK